MSADPYDRVPYDCRAVAQTSPAHLATAALLKGRACAPPDRCALLELGCGDASNLLPLAVAHPESRFVGVDRSRVQIEAGRAVAQALGVANLELVQADVTALPDGLGPFDYVVAHGIYSWVSDEARERILEIFAGELSDRGVGFLSYNTLPGWGIRGYLRDVLRERTRAAEDPLAQVALARRHLALLLEVRVGGPADPYAELLAQMIASLLERSDSYLLHEYLGEHNRAFAVGEVVDALAAHGLRILDDLVRATASPAAHDLLEVQLYRHDLPAREVDAAADLLTFRQLRASLVCRDDGPPRPASPQHVFETCEVAAALRPLEAAPWEAETEQRFATPAGTEVSARSLPLRAALTLLGEAWPASMRFDALLARAAQLASAHAAEPLELPPAELEAVFVDLMRLRALGLVELRAHPPRLVTRIAAAPRVSRLTRHEAARGRPVTTQLHTPVALDPLTAAVATMLDGERDLSAVTAAIARALETGALAPRDGDPPPASAADLVRASVRFLAQSALLTG